MTKQYLDLHFFKKSFDCFMTKLKKYGLDEVKCQGRAELFGKTCKEQMLEAYLKNVIY